MDLEMEPGVPEVDDEEPTNAAGGAAMFRDVHGECTPLDPARKYNMQE
jgi:hypothetical protein